jgi:hypothetical protein
MSPDLPQKSPIHEAQARRSFTSFSSSAGAPHVAPCSSSPFRSNAVPDQPAGLVDWRQALSCPLDCLLMPEVFFAQRFYQRASTAAVLERASPRSPNRVTTGMNAKNDIVERAPDQRPQFNHKGIGSALLLFVLSRGTREP